MFVDLAPDWDGHSQQEPQEQGREGRREVDSGGQERRTEAGGETSREASGETGREASGEAKGLKQHSPLITNLSNQRHQNRAFWCLQMKNKPDLWSLVSILQQ